MVSNRKLNSLLRISIQACVMIVLFSANGLNLLAMNPSNYQNPAKADFIELDREKWNSLREELNYDPSNTSDSDYMKSGAKGNGEGNGERAEEEYLEVHPSDNNSSSFTLPFLGETFKLLIIGAVIAIIAFVVIKVLGGEMPVGNKKVNPYSSAINMKDLEDNIHEADLEQHLKDALDSKAYKKTIRIYYLMIIKDLSTKKWIHWKKDKTNGEYLYEMASRPENKEFSQLTNIFERIWYSDQYTDESIDTSYMDGFKSFLNTLNTK